MEKTSHIKDLIATMQWLRSKQYQDLPGILVTQILEIEANLVENQTDALKQVAKAVESFLDEENK